MTYCSVKGCNNATHTHHKALNITFHSFPLDPIISAEWTRKLRLNRREENWQPKKFTKICSVHFEEKDKFLTKNGLCRLHKGAVPTKGLHINCTEEGHNSEDDDNCETQILDMLQPQMELHVECGKFSQISMEDPDESCYLETPQEEAIYEVNEAEMESLFETPHEAALRKQLTRKILLEKKHKQTIKSLIQTVERLKKKNYSLKRTLTKLKKSFSDDVEDLQQNVAMVK